MKLHKILLLVGSGLTASLLHGAAPVAGLQAHWTFDDVGAPIVVDQSGNGHDATLVNGAAQVTTGLKYGSMYTDGTNQGAQFQSTDSPQITISAWIKPELPSTPMNPRVVETNGYRFFVSYDEYKVDVVFEQDYKDTDPMTPANQQRAKWRVVMPFNYADTWMHIAVKFDRSVVTNQPTFYINGKKQDVLIDHVPPPDASFIGHGIGYSFKAMLGNNPQLYRGFTGQLDEVRIYSRLLSDSEVGDIYEADYPFFFFPGLVDIGGGFHNLPWYGDIDITTFPDVYSAEHGWLYFGYLTIRPTDYVYTAFDHHDLRWVVFSRNNYPRIYSYTLDDDLLYTPGTGTGGSGRAFLNLDTGVPFVTP